MVSVAARLRLFRTSSSYIARSHGRVLLWEGRGAWLAALMPVKLGARSRRGLQFNAQAQARLLNHLYRKS